MSSRNPAKPEERLVDEPIAAWAALVDFLGLAPADRSIKNLLALYKERGASGLPTPTESRTTLQNWCEAYDWAGRAHDHDMLLASRVAEEVTSAAVDAREQRLRVAGHLLNAAEGMTEKLAKMIADIPTLVNIPPRDVAAIAKLAAELSRTEHAPDQAHITVDSEGVHVPVTEETVKELAEALRKSMEARVGAPPTGG